MKKHINNNERGVALLFVLFALLLLTAIAAGLMFMSDTESGINLNYRSEQQAYFGAMAGLQEARQRLIRPAAGGDLAPLLTTMPTAAAPTGVIYITNPANAAEVVQPWIAGDTFMDTELCHELFPGIGVPPGQIPVPNVPCGGNVQTQPPAGAYSIQRPSNMAGFNVASPLSYKWVRITWKQNQSSAPYTTDGTAVLDNFNGPAPAGMASASYPVVPNGNTQICFDGTRQILKPAAYIQCDDDPPPGINMYKPVYILTSLAVTPSGARRMLQMEVADSPPFLTNAALDTDDFIATNGSSLTINGYDNCKCSCNIAKGNATPTCTDRISGLACTGNTYAVFTSKTITSSGTPAIVAGTNPPAAQNQVFPYDVAALITQFKNAPGVTPITGAPYNQVCSGTPANCGTMTGALLGTPPSGFPTFDPANPAGVQNQVTYIPGNMDFQAHSQGAGVLIVDGDLTIHGGIDFYGLILVRGVITFAGGGAGQSNNVFGSILAGNGGIADNSLGGSVNIQYDRCALLNNQTPQPPVTLSAREVTY